MRVSTGCCRTLWPRHFTGHLIRRNRLEEAGPHTQPVEQLPLTQVNRMITGGLPARHMLQAAQQPEQTAAATESDNSGADAPASLADANSSELGHVAKDVDAAMASLIEAGQVHVHRHENWVTVDISSDILFASGAARLSPGPRHTAAAGRFSQAVPECDSRCRSYRQSADQHHGVPFQLGTVGGTCCERGASVHGSRDCSAALWPSWATASIRP
jgi:hypothetical protein